MIREVKSILWKYIVGDKSCKRNYGSLKNDVRPCDDNDILTHTS